MTTSKTQREQDTTGTLFNAVGGRGLNVTWGIQLAVSWVFFIGGGVWLDRHRGGGLVFTFLGLGLGLAYFGYEVWKIIRQPGSTSSARPPVGDDPHKTEVRR